MKYLKYLLSVFCFVAFTGTAFAGGMVTSGAVSAGGGGIVNPDPSTPEKIEEIVKGPAGILIKILLNRIHQWYLWGITVEGRAPSELESALFGGETDALTLLENMTIEIEDEKPCYAPDGSERDGSTESESGKDMCISSFSIAPKVNKYNEIQEVAALIVHEMMHLLGHDEEFSEYAQVAALDYFHHIGVHLSRLRLSNLAWSGSSIILQSFDLVQSIGHLNQRTIENLKGQMINYQLDLIGGFNLFYIGAGTNGGIDAQLLRMDILKNFYCANDTEETESMRAHCQERLETAFGNRSESSLAEIANRWGQPMEPGYSWSEDIVQRPTAESAVSELTKVQEFLQGIQQELQNLHNFSIQTFK